MWTLWLGYWYGTKIEIKVFGGRGVLQPSSAVRALNALFCMRASVYSFFNVMMGGV